MATSDLWHAYLQLTLSQNAMIYLKQSRKDILHSNCLINLYSLVLAVIDLHDSNLLKTAFAEHLVCSSIRLAASWIFYLI